MRRQTSMMMALCGILAAAACQVSAPEGPGHVLLTSRTAAALSLSGTVVAPAALISNNGAGLVSNNGAGIVGNNGSSLIARAGSFALLAVAEQPAAQAGVSLVDTGGKAIAGVPTVLTDASGRFTLTNVPHLATVVVQAALPGRHATLDSLAAPGTQAPTAVSVASTFATAALLSSGKPVSFDAATFQRVTAALEQALGTPDLGQLGNTPAMAARVATIAQGDQALQVDLASFQTPAAASPPASPSPVPSTTTSATPSTGATVSPSAAAASPTPTASLPPVTITGMSPSRGSPGTLVTVFTTNLGTATPQVAIAGTPADVRKMLSNGVVVAVPTGAGTGVVTLTQAGHTATGGTFAVVAPGTVLHRYNLGGQGASELAMTPDGDALVTNMNSNNVTKVEVGGTVLPPFPVGKAPQGIARDSQGNVWVYDTGDHALSELNSDGSLIATVPISDTTTYGLLFADAAGHLWVPLWGAGKLLELDATGKTLASFTVGAHAYGVASDSLGGVWVTCNGADSVYRVNAGVLSGPFNAPVGPNGLVADASGHMWVANYSAGNVTRYASDGTAAGPYPIGSTPHDVAIDLQGRVWATNTASDTVTVLNGDGTHDATYPVGGSPAGIQVDGAGNVWVVLQSSNQLIEMAP